MTDIGQSATRRLCMAALLAAALPSSGLAADRAALEHDARAALQKLTSTLPAAKSLQPATTAVLVFPKVTKAGLGIGGQHGDGVLFRGAKSPATTTPAAPRGACRPVRSSSATPCS